MLDFSPISNAVIGDVYNVVDTGSNYCWNGNSWDKLSEDIDLSGLATKVALSEEKAERIAEDNLKVNITDFEDAISLVATKEELASEAELREAGDATKVDYDSLLPMLDLKADKENLIDNQGGIKNALERITSSETAEEVLKNTSTISNTKQGSELNWKSDSNNVVASVKTKECSSNTIGTQLSVTYLKNSKTGAQAGRGSRLSVALSGIYYTKNKNNDNIDANDEILVKGDLSTAMSGCYSKTEIDNMVTQLRDKDTALTNGLNSEVSTRASEDARVLVEN